MDWRERGARRWLRNRHIYRRYFSLPRAVVRDLLIPVVYLVAFGSVAMYVATRRMTRAMLR
ncbi:hypothetical protein GA0070607_5815 [Micromonospora coriariae]|uniref:ABC-2 type transport system permease protein n=1 Tax=Micromonospora coriariae TaxID=285665 RepID=A0A1C4XV19_9ACTN|nr:hypothetical protein [Micromonospora coriariae]SCF12338.1 hypothetical protein GA0070607_5815 [Micromonospora coriariae]